MTFYNLLRILSKISIILTFGIAICLSIAIFYNENYTPFLNTLLILSCLYLIFWIINRRHEEKDISKRQSYLIVTCSWLYVALVGALPYYFSEYMSGIDSFFESTSGFTTTGSSILSDIESLPKSILFWRSLTHWIGGIGIIVIVIIIMPSLKIGAYNIFSLESSLNEKILPKIKSVGITLITIYSSLTLTEYFFLIAGNMNSFDAICHSFGTVATGGFSPKNTSIANYSPYIQYVITIFMFLAGINFSLYFFLIKKKFSKVSKNEELRLYISATLFFILLITSILYFQTDRPLEKSIRDASFQVVSIITCTGFASDDYMLWPNVGWTLMFFLLFAGGCMGSTAGGIKMLRHLIVFKNIKQNFKELLYPRSVSNITYNSIAISEKTNSSIITFFMIYFILFIIGGFILMSLKIDAMTSFSSIATAMGGVGPGLGSVGPAGNFAHLPNAAKLIIPIFMIIGRLEIYTFIIITTKYFWKN